MPNPAPSIASRRRIAALASSLLRRCWALPWLLAATACGGGGPPPGPAAWEEVAIVGCRVVVRRGDARGPACVLPVGKPVTIVAPSGELSVTVDGKALTAPTTGSADGYTRYAVTMPAQARELRVRSRDGLRERAFALAPFVDLRWLDDADRARKSGNIEEARRIAREKRGSSDPSVRAFATGLVGRIELSTGDTAQAKASMREAIVAHDALGHVSAAIDDRLALAFVQHQRDHDFTGARTTLDEVALRVGDYPEGAARLPYYRATLATEVGDERTALALLSVAESAAERLALAALSRNVRSARALSLVQLGRFDEATSTLESLASPASGADELSPCDRAEAWINLGWALASTEPAADVQLARARAALTRAADESGCTAPHVRAQALGNLSLVSLMRGDAVEARRLVAAARASTPTPQLREALLWIDVDGRADLVEGRASRALARFRDELEMGERAALDDVVWRAETGRGEALEALGRRREALDAYQRAEATLDRGSAQVPLGHGRAKFIAGRERSARLAVDLAVRLHLHAVAAQVARRARTRLLSGISLGARVASLSPADRARYEAAVGSYRTARARLDAAADEEWRVPASALAARRAAREREGRGVADALESVLAAAPRALARPRDEAPTREGEVWLVIHPTRAGYAALFLDDHAVAGHVVASPEGTSPSAIARALLAPARPLLDRARRLLVLASGAYRAVDVHALPWREGALGDHLEVAYRLDVRAAQSPSAPSRLAIIADPTSDLPSAREEARAVAARVPIPTTMLVGDEASRPRVVEVLASHDAAHYAGHGALAGRDGVESQLPLARGAALNTFDILALERVPRFLVLSGCEIARASSDGSAVGLGIAHAFLVAGADFVIAPTRTVRDSDARALASALYGRAEPPWLSPERALREAVRAAAGAGASADLTAYRVLVP